MTNPNSDQLWNEMHSLLQQGGLVSLAVKHGNAYIQESYNRRVAPSDDAVAALKGFYEPFPAMMGDPFAIIDRLHKLGSPGTLAQTGGRFFGLVNGSVVPTGLAARMLADTWDQNAVLHGISPTNAVLEDVCQTWLRDIFNLPTQTVAGFVSGTSMAIVCGLAAARWRLCQQAGHDINADGLASGPRLRIVTSKHAHSTVWKAIALLGFGTSNVETVDVDDQGRLLVDELPELDAQTILILQAGNVNSGSFDPIRAACEKANKAGAWV
ncbi:unnamed protein product, partial [Ectocarpus sp. 12 AP-2014]